MSELEAKRREKELQEAMKAYEDSPTEENWTRLKRMKQAQFDRRRACSH